MSRSSKFDRVVVGRVVINVIEQPSSMTAEAAFVDTTTGATHGQTTCRSWSVATNAKLRELLDLMSLDLEATHFADGPETASTIAGGGLSSVPQGLGEHFGANEDDIPQG